MHNDHDQIEERIKIPKYLTSEAYAISYNAGTA
jgi:hypothetical protein